MIQHFWLQSFVGAAQLSGVVDIRRGRRHKPVYMQHEAMLKSVVMCVPTIHSARLCTCRMPAQLQQPPQQQHQWMQLVPQHISSHLSRQMLPALRRALMHRSLHPAAPHHLVQSLHQVLPGMQPLAVLWPMHCQWSSLRRLQEMRSRLTGLMAPCLGLALLEVCCCCSGRSNEALPLEKDVQLSMKVQRCPGACWKVMVQQLDSLACFVCLLLHRQTSHAV